MQRPFGKRGVPARDAIPPARFGYDRLRAAGFALFFIAMALLFSFHEFRHGGVLHDALLGLTRIVGVPVFGLMGLLMLARALDVRDVVIIDQRGFLDRRLFRSRLEWDHVLDVDTNSDFMAIRLDASGSGTPARSWVARLFGVRTDPLFVPFVGLNASPADVREAFEKMLPEDMSDQLDRRMGLYVPPKERPAEHPLANSPDGRPTAPRFTVANDKTVRDDLRDITVTRAKDIYQKDYCAYKYVMQWQGMPCTFMCEWLDFGGARRRIELRNFIGAGAEGPIAALDAVEAVLTQMNAPVPTASEPRTSYCVVLWDGHAYECRDFGIPLN